MKTIVLASGSPQRSALLAQIRLPFVTMRPDIHEDAIHDGPEDFARLVARDKALEIYRRILDRRIDARRDAVSDDMLVISRLMDAGRLWVLGADTLIDLDGAILGKPSDHAEARSMIERLSGREHVVITGVCLLIADPHRFSGVVQTRSPAGDGRAVGGGAVGDGAESTEPVVELASVRTTVRFGSLSAAEIERYVGSEDWREAAGAYRIQSLGAALIDSIDGSYSNVVGLPLRRFCGMLQQYGYYD